jgi:hypothetical protein
VRRVEVKPSCEDCKASHKRKKKATPCSKCMPPLLPQNEDAAFIYFKVQTQVLVAGMGDIIDLNYLAVEYVMRLYKIEDEAATLERVVAAYRRILKEKKDEKE